MRLPEPLVEIVCEYLGKLAPMSFVPVIESATLGVDVQKILEVFIFIELKTSIEKLIEVVCAMATVPFGSVGLGFPVPPGGYV